jgi:hypothetical protein
MFTALLLLAASALTPSQPAASSATADPPIRIWFNSDGDYALGDRAKVYAKAADSGYLLVLRADVTGKVRVLFPINPRDDQSIAEGKKYELKGRGGREAFVADDKNGHGTVLAAVSETPFKVDAFSRDGHWDTEALSTDQVRNDPEVGLLGLVQEMKPAGSGSFKYDVASYVVSERYDREIYPYPYGGYGWWGYDPWWGTRLGYGFYYRPWYRPWHF